MQFSEIDINSMEQRKRALFVNSLSGFKSANLVGTTNAAGVNNLAIVSSVFHLGASPALMGMIFRPNSVRRDSFENILDTKYYTLNGVAESFVKAAHQTSARYLAEQSEFTEVGLTPQFSEAHPAPYVQESPLKIGLEYVEHQVLKVNDTILMIGKIIEVLTQDSAVKADGFVDIESLGLVALSSLDSYHSTNNICRLSYAKPNLPLKELP